MNNITVIALIGLCFHSLSVLAQPSGQEFLTLDDQPMQISDIKTALADTDSHSTDNSYPLYLTIPEDKDWSYLKEQTYTVLGSAVTIVGVMSFMPEGITGWDKNDRSWDNLTSKWRDNVTAGPQWDNDDIYLNYVMHPYFGGIYYTASRHAGFNPYESTIYSFMMSTFFWEYGVEAFAERPSYQDLVVTPLLGSVVGEMMIYQEQAILANGGEVLGSTILGNISLFFLNPVGHIHHWITGIWEDDTQLHLTYDRKTVGLTLELKF